jgi:3-(methylthio)propanoyl-CoA dehydrogenase
LGIAAQSVGIADAAYREAVAYAKERVQFGSTISKFPAVYEMISKMKAKVDAIRTLLYETARFVDVYKAYEHISKERTLTPDERNEMKTYQKVADIFTPMAKGLSSEVCNQVAYDSLQIHGGSGFMKDYPIERIYRDARITSIYEGTTQLQVVAAVRGVTTGGYLAKMRAYEQLEIKPELLGYRSHIVEMTDDYEYAVDKVMELDNNEYTDFHARRLVEMAGNIIMSHLLVLDANRDHKYWKSLDIFLKIAQGENMGKLEFINITNPSDLGKYKID